MPPPSEPGGGCGDTRARAGDLKRTRAGAAVLWAAVHSAAGGGRSRAVVTYDDDILSGGGGGGGSREAEQLGAGDQDGDAAAAGPRPRSKRRRQEPRTVPTGAGVAAPAARQHGNGGPASRGSQPSSDLVHPWGSQSRRLGNAGVGGAPHVKRAPPPGYLCVKCKVPGHYCKDCPRKADKGQGKGKGPRIPPGYVCNICRVPGHFIKDCPDRQAPANKARPPECRFYLKGSCQKGAECPFSHDRPPDKVAMVCRFHLSGSCLKGSICLYSHDLKLVPCQFFHAEDGIRRCDRGDGCTFSHAPLCDDQRAYLAELRAARQKAPELRQVVPPAPDVAPWAEEAASNLVVERDDVIVGPAAGAVPSAGASRASTDGRQGHRREGGVFRWSEGSCRETAVFFGKRQDGQGVVAAPLPPSSAFGRSPPTGREAFLQLDPNASPFSII